MGDIIFLVTCLIATILMAAGTFYSLNKKGIQIETRISVYLGANFESNQSKVLDESHLKEFSNIKRLLAPLINRLTELVINRMASNSSKNLERKLQEAGYPFKWTPVDFRVTQIMSATIILGVFLLLGLPGSQNPFKVIMMGCLGSLIGYWYPNAILRTRKLKRIKEIEKTMPDFFDMTNLAIEAGMGLDAAILRVCKTIKGALSNEFLITLEDMKLGMSRRDAFINLRNRVPSDNFQSIITQIIQADSLGIGMAKVIKSLTQRIREQQRESARERAMKVPVKMLIPIVLFIFPSLFIIILGPAALNFLKNGL